MTDRYTNKDIKSVTRWNPNPAPSDPTGLPDYLFNELNRLAEIIFNIDVLRLEQTYVEPGSELTRKTKPRNGDIRYADGTKWDPGSGAGIYFFNGSTWAKL
tara:strand:- start:8799 stop:9101 length:303 start_codon:yes stop_codon:yes gene_type:complete